MAGQNPSRREVLEALGLASMAAFAPGFRRWACAQEMQHAMPVPTVRPPGAYVPVFFSADEFTVLEVLADLILPADGDMPGAKAAGAAEFVDFWVSQEPSLQNLFSEGFTELEHVCRKAGGRFDRLRAEEQMALLRRLAYRKEFRKEEVNAQKFFALVRKYVVIGFYTSELGFKALDSPFLTFYAESPGCPHPEEFHLT